MTPLRLLPALCWVAAGCAAHFPMPMSAADVAGYNSGPALVAYLTQPDASADVCDLQAQTPHISTGGPEIRAHLVQGLLKASIAPDLWTACVTLLVQRLPAEDAASLLDQLLRAHVQLAADSTLAVDPILAGRLLTIHRLYLQRKAGAAPHPNVVDKIAQDVRDRIADQSLSPLGAYYDTELLDTFDVERGLWQSQPVTAPVLDQLAADGNEMTLTRLAARLPSEEQRTEAKRRLVRVHIELSPFDEVRKAAAAVEEAVIQTGHNALDLSAHPVTGSRFDARQSKVNGAGIRQQIWQKTATLVAISGGKTKVVVVPEVPFRNGLVAEAQGVSHTVTVCGQPKELDPSPCIEGSAVTIDTPYASVDKWAVLRFNDHVGLDLALSLVPEDTLTIPVSIAGKPAVSLKWALGFERPENFVFGNGYPGGRGPDVSLRVEQRFLQRYVFRANGYAAVVEGRDLLSYRAGSSGAQGPGGYAGAAGADGANGGECENGQSGDDGGDGGPGGPGGDGGQVTVSVDCGSANPGGASQSERDKCTQPVVLLKQAVFSFGGPGGRGGAGGAGGSGGSGGSGRAATGHTDADGSWVVDDPGCSAGSSGANGSQGANGPDGPPGHPGTVTFLEPVPQS